MRWLTKFASLKKNQRRIESKPTPEVETKPRLKISRNTVDDKMKGKRKPSKWEQMVARF